MRINVEVEAGQPWLLAVNGAVQAQGLAAAVVGRDDMAEEVKAARCAMALPKIVQHAASEAERAGRMPAEGMSTQQREDAFARGLRDGLLGRMEKLNGPLLPGALAESNLPYRSGYEAGAGLVRAATGATALEGGE